MPIDLPTPKPRGRLRSWNGPAATAVGICIAGASAACTLLWTIPPPLVLPSIGVIAMLTAAAVALIAWRTAQHPAATLTYWDVAGGLTFVGIVATLISEPELALPFFDQPRTE